MLMNELALVQTCTLWVIGEYYMVGHLIYSDIPSDG